MRKFIILFLTLLLACSSKGTNSALKIGFDPTFFTYNLETAKMNGYIDDLILRLSKDLRVEIEMVPMSWNTLTSGLEGKKVDLALSNLPKNLITLKNFTFSSSLLSLGPVIATRKGQEANINIMGGKTVLLQMTPESSTLIARYPEVYFDFYSDLHEAFIPLQTGRVAAILLPHFQALLYQEGLNFDPTPLTDQALTFIATKINDPWIGKINDSLERLEKRNEIHSLKEKWGLSLKEQKDSVSNSNIYSVL